ncbi:hypothetical protein Gogos_017382, partial [Gossypium gossypioides]|nr:hypothetical protein [Gossypium gossypioides]
MRLQLPQNRKKKLLLKFPVACSHKLFMSDFGEQFNKIITDLTFKSKVAKLDEKFKSSVGDDYDSVDRAALADEVAASPE